MDIRIERTKRSIINAFLQLRSAKSLEKITVRELTTLAGINKATFYLHYHDIYHLSETLEEDIVHTVVSTIEHPQCIFSDTRLFVQELGQAFISNEQLIAIIFEGSRSFRFVQIIEQELRRIINEDHPEYLQDKSYDMTLTYMIYGAYFTYDRFRDRSTSDLFEMIANINSAISTLFK